MIIVPVITGPTASGKTALGLEAARRFGLEIISCDSRQIYRHLDIGTAKPTAVQRREVKHWLVDFVDPSDRYSAHQWASEAQRIIRERHAAGKRLIIVGGTGLYLRALSDGLGAQPAADPVLRQRYEEKVRTHGAEAIFKELAEVDPLLAGWIHPNDVRRSIRALEVYHTTGRTPSELRKRAQPPGDIEFRIIVATLPRVELYQKINERADHMAASGLWDEFVGIIGMGYTAQSPGMQTLGYQELFAVHEGRMTFVDGMELVKQSTRRYAKKQMTWVRHQIRGTVLDLSACPVENVFQEVGKSFG